MVLRTLEIADEAPPLMVTITGKLTCRCPVNQRRDFARVDVSYRPSGRIIELESFASYLATWSQLSFSHETVTRTICVEIAEAIQNDTATVTTVWDAVEGIECVVVAG